MGSRGASSCVIRPAREAHPRAGGGDLRLTVVAVGSRGDVQPYVGLAAGLAAAGMDVTVATHGPFRALVEGRGLAFAALRSDPQAAMATAAGQAWVASSRNPVTFVARMVGLALEAGEDLGEDVLAATEGAEGLVYSPLGLAAFHVAEARRVPAVPAFLAPASPTRAFASPVQPLASLGPLNPLTHRAAAAAFDRPFRRRINRWRRDHLGLAPIRGRNPYLAAAAAGAPVLYGFSPRVVPVPADWGAGAHVTGYWTLPPDPSWRPPPVLVDFLAAGPAPVYAGFGSMGVAEPGRLARTVVAAARRARRRLVLGRGWAGLEAGGDDVLVVDDVPHEWLFPRTAGVVHHGGAGTTAAALRSGVPSLACPFFADQFFWARRAAALGVGPAPLRARALDAERLGLALLRLTGPAHRTRGAAVGTALRAEDGIAAAVAVLRRVLSAPRGRGRPSSSTW